MFKPNIILIEPPAVSSFGNQRIFGGNGSNKSDFKKRLTIDNVCYLPNVHTVVTGIIYDRFPTIGKNWGKPNNWFHRNGYRKKTDIVTGARLMVK